MSKSLVVGSDLGSGGFSDGGSSVVYWRILGISQKTFVIKLDIFIWIKLSKINSIWLTDASIAWKIYKCPKSVVKFLICFNSSLPKMNWKFFKHELIPIKNFVLIWSQKWSSPSWRGMYLNKYFVVHLTSNGCLYRGSNPPNGGSSVLHMYH
jgi:hypothetical protein